MEVTRFITSRFTTDSNSHWIDRILASGLDAHIYAQFPARLQLLVGLLLGKFQREDDSGAGEILTTLCIRFFK